MSSAVFTVHGLDEVHRQFALLGAEANDIVAQAITNAFRPIEQAMKNNAATMFNKGYSTGTMQQSIAINVAKDKDWVGASVGVFDLSKKGIHYGKVSGRLVTAPMIAMFYETGIQPHYTVKGTRTERRETALSRYRKAKFSNEFFDRSQAKRDAGRGELNPHRGSPPIPFLSMAWDALAPAALDQLDAEIDAAVQAII